MRLIRVAVVAYRFVMKCPACDRILVPRDLGQVTVDVCDGGCGGIWLDNFELTRLDKELSAKSREVAQDPDLVIDQERRRACPRCDGVKMQRRYFSATQKVEVDSCPGCGGYWLDAGELDQISQNNSGTPADSKPIRVHVPKPSEAQATAGGGGVNRLDRAQTLDSLYRMLGGSKY